PPEVPDEGGARGEEGRGPHPPRQEVPPRRGPRRPRRARRARRRGEGGGPPRRRVRRAVRVPARRDDVRGRLRAGGLSLFSLNVERSEGQIGRASCRERGEVAVIDGTE